MVMTEEMMDAIEKDNMVFLATATEDGTPNVVPIGFARPIDNKTIMIVDNYLNKTRKNLENNPKASLVIRDASKAPYQFKGTVEIIESGKYFDEAVDWATSVMSQLAPKAAVLLNVEEIYSVQPGPDAGSKVD
ncbi:pyridoxamine 5'-phosphate oxidase family protein [Methanobacterium sp.]|uniref:pyridoxamine 5'-phosphate oxidase family protein n=1 Tax=Methanobacterium sp. TaxID=2164 RepID=UPI003C722B8D